MSLLSSTQGRPDRVRSLLRVLKAHDGTCSRSELERWMLPSAFKISESKTAFMQTVQAARSLKLISPSVDPIVLAGNPPIELNAFADHVHRVLVTEPGEADEVMMNAFAFFVIACEQERGSAWIKTLTNPDLAGRVDAAIRSGEEEGERQFNKDKYPAWRDWMYFIGLGMEAATLPSFYPYPVGRLERELDAVGEHLGIGSEIPASAFLAQLAVRMPYMDGGTLFKRMAEKMAWPPPEKRLTRVLSLALRELHDDESLVLHQLGDNPDSIQLFRDPGHKINHFYAVTLTPRRNA